MARPLPNTNAPASVKYHAMRHRVSPAAGPWRPVTSPAGNATPRADALGVPMPLAKTAIAPAARNTHTISDSVHAVTIADTAASAHRRRSRPRVIRVSFAALRAMTAITAAPTP
jgi:hypothetical protein